MKEQWLPIPGYENSYEVSLCGQVRNKKRQIWNGRAFYTIPQRIIYQTKSEKRKYCQVRLSVNGIAKTYDVHRLMALAFLGPPPTTNAEVRHIDGNRANQTIENIQWGTPKENCTDRIEHGVQFVLNLGYMK